MSYGGTRIPPHNRRVRVGNSPPTAARAVFLPDVYKLAYRQTEGFLHSIASLLGLGIEIPDYSTLCRRSRLLRKKLRIPKAASTQTHPPDDR